MGVTEMNNMVAAFQELLTGRTDTVRTWKNRKGWKLYLEQYLLPWTMCHGSIDEIEIHFASVE